MYSIDYTLTIRAVPNPFIVGISEIPASILQAGSTRGVSDFKKGISIEIKTDPLALMNSNKITLDASVHIIDAVGNIIIQSKGLTDTQKDIVLIKHPKTGKLYFLWNGKNRNRRLIGKGVYSALIKVVDNNKKEHTKNLMIGARQEML